MEGYNMSVLDDLIGQYGIKEKVVKSKEIGRASCRERV